MSIMDHNGGIVLAMRGGDCVTIGCDLRLGSRFLTIMNDKEKIFQITRRLVEKMLYRTSVYNLRENRDVTPEVFSQMLSNLLYENRFSPYFCEPVVAGIDWKTSEPYVANMDLIGCICKPNDFVLSGTGDLQMYGMCESVWEKNMDRDAAFEATAQALLACIERDAASGWGAVVYTISNDEIDVKSIKARLD
ncbi:peptidase, T1 family [Trichinella nativa]|uniref:Peptidase, T1 family n=1 Tax=Trichinella nativa TaxID=6335 RepID=A0A1Y3ES22_9BILA|nr:peptidase, T1 family [Trichinella nativa]